MKTLPAITAILLCGLLFSAFAPRPVPTGEERENLRRLYRLSEIYERGSDSVMADTVRSLLLLREAAEGGLPEAQNYLGFVYMTGKLLPSRPDSALFWLKRAADAGFSTAAANIGYMYAEGIGVGKDREKAMEWLGKAAALDNPAAESQMADLLLSGNATHSDTLAAAGLYERAARHGFPPADMKLSAIMSTVWEKLPSDSLLSLARRHYTGSLPRSGIALLRIILSRKAVDRRVEAEAATILAHAYSHGRGVGYDHTAADALFLKGALLGNPAARAIIAETLEIFPDFLSLPENMRVLKEFFGEKNIPEEIRSPFWWHPPGSPPPKVF